jgi:hypothetical protein
MFCAAAGPACPANNAKNIATAVARMTFSFNKASSGSPLHSTLRKLTARWRDVSR